MVKGRLAVLSHQRGSSRALPPITAVAVGGDGSRDTAGRGRQACGPRRQQPPGGARNFRRPGPGRYASVLPKPRVRAALARERGPRRAQRGLLARSESHG
ncbi:unnamed protein product, partial [Ascophyllum nodosum]